MRISDWSSDVCSSDLLGAGRGVVLHGVLPVYPLPVGVCAAPSIECQRHGCSCRDRGIRRMFDPSNVDYGGKRPDSRSGRQASASRRGGRTREEARRVGGGGQDVWVWGVAGTLKKKKHNQP